MPDAAASLLAQTAVVVVAYASAETIGACLSGLPLNSLADVVVVDNASPDDTAAVVRQLALPNVRLIEADVNRGFGAGCNIGTRAVQPSRWVLFLNPDATIDRDSLLTMCRYLADHPEVGLVAPMLSDGVEFTTPGGRVATVFGELRFVVPRRIAWLTPERRLPPARARTGPIGVVEGACMLFDSASLLRVGMFDERYFLFFEEHDLARRLRQDGREVHLVAEATAEHHTGGSRRSVPLDGRPAYFASAYLYLERWHGRAAAAVYSRVALLNWALLERSRKLQPDKAAALRGALVGARSRG